MRYWCRRNRAVANLATAVLLLITTLAVVSSIGAVRLGKALSDVETNLNQAREANADANAKLWDSLLSQARAGRLSVLAGPKAERAIRARVTGKVQGVFFRDSTVTRAGELGVLGWVRNDEAGDDVLVHAEGGEEAVAALIEFLHEGPADAEVADV